MKIRVADKFLLPHFKQWQDILLSGESGNVFFLPYTGFNYRLVQFLNWWSRQNDNSLKLLRIDSLSLEDIDELRKETPTSSKLLIVIDDYFLKEPLQLLDNLEKVLILNQSDALLFHQFFPASLISSQNLRIRQTLLLKNQLYFSLHSYEEVSWFINQLTRDWEIRGVSKLDTDLLYEYSGGYLYLVKQILRDVKKGESVITAFDSNYLLEKENLIWQHFPSEVKALLTQVVFGKGLDNATLIKFNSYVKDLNSFGFFKEHSGKVNPPRFIKRVIERNIEGSISFANSRLIIGGVDITNQLSQTQLKVSKFLFDAYQRDRYATRDELAQTIWGRGWIEKYSDWAIDQHIRRLRLKLNQLNFPFKIKNIKNQGYKLTREI